MIFYLKEDCNIYDNIDYYTIIDNIKSFINLMKLSVSNKFPYNLYKQKIIFYSKSINSDWLQVVNSFNLIEASGGVVKNNYNDFLFIFKNGKWDLPKGKIDSDENPEKAAIREVNEETSLLELEIMHFVTNTYHLYKQESIILKNTFWFLMKARNFKNMKPQKEEGITDLKWFSKKELPSTYNSINYVISKLKD